MTEPNCRNTLPAYVELTANMVLTVTCKQIMYVPTINQLWLNVPVEQGQNQQQFVMNTITGSWCNYTGWNASCMEMFNDEPYFGGNGYVAHAYNGTSDAGTNITAFGLQAFNNFNGAGRLKRFTMSRPILRTDGSPAIYAGINVDFNINDVAESAGATVI